MNKATSGLTLAFFAQIKATGDEFTFYSDRRI